MAEWWKAIADDYYQKNGINPENGDISDVSRETSSDDSNVINNPSNSADDNPASSMRYSGDDAGLYIILDYPGEKPPPEELIKQPASEVPNYTPIDDRELESKALLLEANDINRPKSMKKEKDAHPILDFLHHFNRPGSASLAGIIDYVEQVKSAGGKALKANEEGNLWEGLPLSDAPGAVLRNQLESAGEIIDNVKYGFTAKREEAPTGRDLVKSLIGEENIASTEGFFDKWAGLAGKSPKELEQEYREGKISLGDKMLGILGSGVFGNMNRFFNPTLVGKPMEGHDKISPVLIRNAMQFGVYLPIEIATDPLTYVPFGLPAKMVANGTSNVVRGGLKGVAKLSPGLAENIAKASTKAGEAVEQAYVKYFERFVYPKGAAERTASKVIGGEAAANLIDDIHLLAHSAPGETAEVVKSLDKIVRAPTKVGFIRQGVQSAFEKIGYTPKNKLTKYLAGMEDGREWLKVTTDRLRAINDESVALLGPGLAEETQKTIKNLLSGVASDEEVSRLTKAFERGYTPKQQASSIGFKRSKDLKNDFKAGAKELANEGYQIAKARRDFQMVQLNERNKAFREVLSKTSGEVEHLQKELKTNMNWLTGKTKKTTQVELTRRTRIVNSERVKGINSIKEQASNAIDGLRSAEIPKGTQLERTKFFKSRDAKIAEINLKTEKQLNSLNKYYDGQLKDTVSSLQKEAAGFYKEQAASLAEDFNKKISSAKYGVPDSKHIQDMYERAQSEINRKFNAEAKFFSQEIKKVKFFDSYNKMLSAKAEEFTKIFEKNISDLPKEQQQLARVIRDVMDATEIADVNSGKLKGSSPNYFPRMSKAGEEGKAILGKEQFEQGLRVMMGGNGLSKFTKERIAADYGSFLKGLDEKGLKAIDDIYEIVYNRVLSSKTEQAYKTILQRIPEVLKDKRTGGTATKMLHDYVEGLYKAGKSFDNPILKYGQKAYNAYNFANKALLTTVSPIFHSVNAISAPFMTAAKAGLKAMNPLTYIESVGIKTGGLLEVTNNVGEKVSSKKFMEAGAKYGGLNSTFSNADFVQTLDRTLNRYSKADPRHWVMKAIASGQEIEELNRTNAAYVFWKEGKDLRQAWKLSRDTQFDYGDVNNVTKALNGIYAFFTWRAKNLPAQIKAMANDPKQFAIISNIFKSASAGSQPSSEDLKELSGRDSAQLWVFGQMVNGMQEAQKVGFIPVQEAYGDIRSISQGDVGQYLEDQASFLSPVAKLLVKQVYGLISKDRPQNSNPKLTENQTYLFATIPGAINQLDKLSKFFTGEPLRVMEVPVWRKGEQVMEKRVEAPPSVVEFLNSNPFARIQSEVGAAIKLNSKDKGPGAATISEMLFDGANADDILKFLFGVKYKNFQYDALRDQVKYKKMQEVNNLLEKHKLMGTFNYIKKDFRDQYKAIQSYVKEKEAQQ